jgi:lysophospholipase L1-like esterase
MNRIASAFGKALIAAVSTIVSLLVGEFIVRAIDVPPRPLAPLAIPSYRLSDDPILGFEFRPGYTPEDRPFDWSHAGYAINSDGFRDHEYAIPKPQDTYRIAVIGDSTTAGNGVPDVDRTYTKILERMLNADTTGPTHYEVVNMGVGGYQPMQAVETLKTKGLKYAPDMVILTLCTNDYTLHADGMVYEMLSKLNASTRSRPGPDLRPLLRNSRLAFIVYHRMHTTLTAYDRWYEDNVLEGRSPVRAGLELLSELQSANGFAALVLILPEFLYPFDEYRFGHIHDRMHEDARGISGFDMVDLRDPFRDVSNDAGAFSFDGLHLNEYGHQIMAAIVYPLVRAKLSDNAVAP